MSPAQTETRTAFQFLNQEGWLLVGALLFFGCGIWIGLEYAQFSLYGESTVSTWVSEPIAHPPSGRFGSTRYQINYKFRVGDAIYDGLGSLYSRPSGPITVYYIRHDPTRSIVTFPSPYLGLFGVSVGIVCLFRFGQECWKFRTARVHGPRVE